MGLSPPHTVTALSSAPHTCVCPNRTLGFMIKVGSGLQQHGLERRDALKVHPSLAEEVFRKASGVFCSPSTIATQDDHITGGPCILAVVSCSIKHPWSLGPVTCWSLAEQSGCQGHSSLWPSSILASAPLGDPAEVGRGEEWVAV